MRRLTVNYMAGRHAAVPMQIVVLSPREHDVIRLLVRGVTRDKAIASELKVSPSTVRNYVSGLLHGLGLANRLELVLWSLTHPEIIRHGTANTVPHQENCQCDAVWCRAWREAERSA
jgi:DNA-binding NarL/FixJ family response regulator